MASKKTKSGSGCVETICDPKVKIHDRGTGKSAILLKPDRVQVRRIHVDGCLIPKGNVTADFLVSMPETVDVIVEFKGKNVDHAAKQIEATRLFWCKHAEHESNQTIGAWIVCSEFPKASVKAKKYQEDFRKTGGKLLISTHNGEERAFEEFVP